MPLDQNKNEDKPKGKNQPNSLTVLEQKMMARVQEEFGRYKNMSIDEIEKDVKMAEEERILLEDRVNLMEMSEEERNAELNRRKKEFEAEKAQADKEWQDAVSASNSILAEEDEARLKEEAELMKSIMGEKTDDLIENFKEFLKNKNLAGCGGILKRIAAKGEIAEVLNYYGYPSNISGLHQFFNEIVIGGDKPILGEKAFDNFLFQQKAYAVEREISCLAGGLNQWVLALTMGRKNLAWYQLDGEEHLCAVLHQIKKIKPEVAARNFGPLAYGFFLPSKNYKIGTERIFILSDLGILVLMSFSEILKDQLAKKMLNPEAAIILMENLNVLTQTGVDSSLTRAIEKYGKELNNNLDLKFAELNFRDTNVLKEIKRVLDEVVKFDLIFIARKIISALSKFLREDRPISAEIQAEYQDILARAKFIILPTLGDSEIEEIILSNFTMIFNLSDYDLWAKLKIKLMLIPEFKERDNLKKRIREALSLDEQILTEETVFLDNKKVRGTIKNWLADYRQSLGADKVDIVKLSQYLIGNQNTQSLSETSRKKLDYLLRFYEKLKISSFEIKGMEGVMIFNMDGEIDIFEEGRTERIDRETKDMVFQLRSVSLARDIRESLKNNYEEDDDGIFKKIEIEKEKILKNGDISYQKLIELFWKSAFSKTVNQSLGAATLIILAENGGLTNIFEDKNFHDVMEKYLQGNGGVEADDFNINPKNPKYLIKFIRYALEDKIKLDEYNSAIVGRKLFELLAINTKEKEYRGLIYLDLSDEKLKWV